MRPLNPQAARLQAFTKGLLDQGRTAA